MKRRALIFAVALALLAVFGCSRNAEHPPTDKSTAASKYEGKLIRIENGTGLEGAKVHFVKDGRRQWVASSEWITNHGFQLPQDVTPVSREVLESIPEGPPISAPK